MLQRHLFNLPISGDQAETNFASKMSLNAPMKDTFVIDLDVLFLYLLETFLEEGMRRVSNQATIRNFSLFSFIEAVNLVLIGTLDHPIIIWVGEVVCHSLGCLLLQSTGEGHTMHLEVLKKGLE